MLSRNCSEFRGGFSHFFLGGREWEERNLVLSRTEPLPAGSGEKLGASRTRSGNSLGSLAVAALGGGFCLSFPPASHTALAPSPCPERASRADFFGGRRLKIKKKENQKKKERKKKEKKKKDIYSSLQPVLLGLLGSLLPNPGLYGQEGLVELSREDWERRRVRGPMLESAREEVGKSLYQPETALERSSSSRMIWAIPMKHLWSMRP